MPAENECIQGRFVRVNVPSYNTGKPNAVTRVTALVVADLSWQMIVLTDALGSEMMFCIQQERDYIELRNDIPPVSKELCVERLRTFLLARPNIDVCWVEQPFMDALAIVDHSVTTKVEHRGFQRAVCLYDENDPDASSVFMGMYLEKHVGVASKEISGVETRYKVEKEDYCLQGNPDANVEENTTVDPSRMDILRVYSTYETNPRNGDYNYFEYQAGRFNARTTLKLKPDSAARLKSQIVDSLIQLAENNPSGEAEDDTLDWSSSEFVMGDFEERQVVWIERDPEKDGEFEIKRKSYIRRSTEEI